MDCMKCGKKTENEQVFCSHCLEVMESYPVKPDVHIQLPTHPAAQTAKKQSRKRRNMSIDEQLTFLRSRIRQQWALIAVLILGLLVAVGMLFYTASKPAEPDIGKNYTYIDPTD